MGPRLPLAGKAISLSGQRNTTRTRGTSWVSGHRDRAFRHIGFKEIRAKEVPMPRLLDLETPVGLAAFYLKSFPDRVQGMLDRLRGSRPPGVWAPMALVVDAGYLQRNAPGGRTPDLKALWEWAEARSRRWGTPMAAVLILDRSVFGEQAGDLAQQLSPGYRVVQVPPWILPGATRTTRTYSWWWRPSAWPGVCPRARPPSRW